MWYFNNKKFESNDICNYIGYVYQIQDPNGKKYIGKKKFFSTTKKSPLKGAKRKRTFVKESDWQNYYGSNEELKSLVVGREHEYRRDILHLCNSLGEMSYVEAKIQFQYDVLLKDEFYNSFIGCKIHRKHVKNMLDIES